MKNLLLIFIILFKLNAIAQKPEVVVQEGLKFISNTEFSPDGKYFAAEGNGVIVLWDLKTGKELYRIPIFIYGKEDAGTNFFRFSPDGKYIGTIFNGSELKIWEIERQKEVLYLNNINNFFSFSNDSKKIVFVNSDSHNLEIWNIENKKREKLIYIKIEDYTPLEFGKSDNIIITFLNRKLVLIDVNKENCNIKELSIDSVFFDNMNPNFTSKNKDLIIVQSKSEKEKNTKFKFYYINNLKKLDIEKDVYWFSFSENGRYLYLADSLSFVTWDIKNKSKINELKNIKSIIAINTKKDVFASFNNRRYDINMPESISIRRLIDGCKIKDINTKNIYHHTTYLYSNKLIPKLYWISTDTTMKIWDLSTGFKIFNIKINSFLQNYNYQIHNVESNNGKYLALYHRQEYIYDNSPIIILNLSEDNKLNILSLEENHNVLNKQMFNIKSIKFSQNDNYFICWYDFEKSNSEKEDYVSIWESSDWNLINCVSYKYWNDSLARCYGINNFKFINDNTEILNDSKLIPKMVYDTLFDRDFAFGQISSADISPDSRFYVVGTDEGTLLIWDLLTEKLITKVENYHYSSVGSISFTPDSKFSITGSWDGQIKLWDLIRKESVSLIPFGNNDYIITTEDNYYMCSKNGINAIAFRMDGNAYPPEQFDLQYNRPDIILERIGYAPRVLIDAYRRAYEKRLKKMKFDEGMFNKDFHLPEMKIMDENIPMTTPDKNITFKIKAEDSKYNLDRINVYVNDVPIYGTDGIDLRDKKISALESDIKLELSNGKNKVQVSVLNDKGVESLKETFEISYETPVTKHDLYIVTIGASDYNDSRYKLNFAAKDAKDIGDLFLNQKDKYNDVKVLKLLDKDVTRENILKVKEFLMQSKVDDDVIVFIAGHGLLTKDFDYYFATADIDFINPQKRGVTFEEIESLLDGIPARQKIIFMDTCHSGELDKEDLQIIAQNEKQVQRGDVIFRDVPGVRIGRKNENEGLGLKNTSELMQEMFVDLRRGSGAAVISSSGGLEVSFEGGGIKNGLFTYCIIEGLKTGNADFNKDGKITVSELRDYVSEKVEKLTNGVQKPTTRKENLENDFEVW